jgi:hypothetical protein
MNGYPFTYLGFDGTEYRAAYDPPRQRKPWQPTSRVCVTRTDGEPVTVRYCAGARHYPGGYVACHGDAEALAFLDHAKGDPTAQYRPA